MTFPIPTPLSVATGPRSSPTPAAGEGSAAPDQRPVAPPPGPPGLRSRPVRMPADSGEASAPVARTPSERLAEYLRTPSDLGTRPSGTLHTELIVADAGSSRVRLPTPIGEGDTSSFLGTGLRSESIGHAGPSRPAPAPASHVIDIPPAVPVTPHEEVRASLARLEFTAPPGPARETQQALENRYVDWVASNVVEPRRRAFGEGRYRLEEGTPAIGKDAVLPATYHFARQFLSSASRSPVSGAVTTELAPSATGGQGATWGEFSNGYDPAVVGGAVGGISAYLVGAIALKALDRRAALANFPQLTAVDLKALVPDPGPVQLRIVEGRKQYVTLEASGAAGDFGAMQAELRSEVAARRESLGKWQALLEGKAEGMLLHPVLSGLFNAARRAVAPDDQSLASPGNVFLGSVWASGIAGALAQGGLTTAKGAPWLSQAKVDNFVGGQQQVNLFSVRVSDPATRPASWSDAGRLPRFALDVGREAADLLGHSFDVRHREVSEVGRQAFDVIRHAFANAMASTTAPGTGRLVAQVMRGGHDNARPGESLRSQAYQLQQFGQSATGDLVWNAVREYTKNAAYDLSGSLDRRRDARQAGALREAHRAVEALAQLATRFETGTQTQAQTQALALAQLRTLSPDQDIPVDALRAARATLAAAAAAGAAEVAPLLAGLDAVLRPMAQREALMRWREPSGAPDRNR